MALGTDMNRARPGRDWVARPASHSRQGRILTPEVLGSRGEPQAQLEVLKGAWPGGTWVEEPMKNLVPDCAEP